MSVKIKISFTETEELDRILMLLKPVLKSYNVSNNKRGNYRKAYAELKFRGTGHDKKTHS